MRNIQIFSKKTCISSDRHGGLNRRVQSWISANSRCKRIAGGRSWGGKNLASTGNVACASFGPLSLGVDGLKGQSMSAQGNALGR